MIPLRLTAVAANPNMGVLTWIFAKSQMEPENYTPIKINNDDIVFFQFGSTNYQTLVAQASHSHGGHAFVTEYAGPTRKLNAQDKTLQALLGQYTYLTRFYTKINPEEMTMDPVFHENAALPEVSNVHDLSNDTRVWDCNSGSNTKTNVVGAVVARATDNNNPLVIGMYLLDGAVAAVLLVIGILVLARVRKK
jgi:hypothetical protein